MYIPSVAAFALDANSDPATHKMEDIHPMTSYRENLPTSALKTNSTAMVFKPLTCPRSGRGWKEMGRDTAAT